MEDNERQWLQREFDALKEGQVEISKSILNHEGRISSLEKGETNDREFSKILTTAKNNWRTYALALWGFVLTALVALGLMKNWR